MTPTPIHLVSKSNNAKTTIGYLDQSPENLPDLGPSSVRVRTQLISLSSNNLTYALAGDRFAWWSAYPVPAGTKLRSTSSFSSSFSAGTSGNSSGTSGTSGTSGSSGNPSPETQREVAKAQGENADADDADADLNKNWGIVPAWGYALVTSSTHPLIPSGSLLWGFWPTSSHLFDLSLSSFPSSDSENPSENQPETHFRETSSHRAGLMAMYNRYILIPSATSSLTTSPTQSQSPQSQPLSPTRIDLESNEAAQTALSRPVFECGLLLEKFTLNRQRYIHPLGLPRGAPANTIPGVPAWTEKDADLRKAVVVSLSAGTKTGRGFGWMLACERARRGGEGGELEREGPRGLVQITSVPGTLADFGQKGKTKLKVKNVGYGAENLRGVVEWIRQLQEEEGVERVVMVDFGAANEVTELLIEGLRSTSSSSSSSSSPSSSGINKELDVLVLAVGNESKVYSGEEFQARITSGQALGKVQFNTSGVRDRAAEVEGATDYFDGVDEAWKRCYTETGLGEVRIERYRGVEGANGIEGAWGALCEHKLAPNTGIVVQLLS